MYVVIRQPKSMGIAILLAILLGPIGLFYASVTGGLIMTFVPFIAIVYVSLKLGVAYILVGMWAGSVMYALFGWIICIIWAVMAVSDYNRKLLLNSVNSTALFSHETNNSNETTEVVREVRNNNSVSVLFSIILGVVIVYIIYYFIMTSGSKKTETMSQWSIPDNTYVYSSPNIKSNVVNQINSDHDIEVIGETKYFRKVRVDVNGNVVNGYILKSTITQNF